MSPATKTRINIAEGVTRDLHRCDPNIAREYVDRLQVTAGAAFDRANSAKDKRTADRLTTLAHAKREEYEAAKSVLDVTVTLEGSDG